MWDGAGAREVVELKVRVDLLEPDEVIIQFRISIAIIV
jgi:hypothetical protein